MVCFSRPVGTLLLTQSDPSVNYCQQHGHRRDQPAFCQFSRHCSDQHYQLHLRQRNQWQPVGGRKMPLASFELSTEHRQRSVEHDLRGIRRGGRRRPRPCRLRCEDVTGRLGHWHKHSQLGRSMPQELRIEHYFSSGM